MERPKIHNEIIKQFKKVFHPVETIEYHKKIDILRSILYPSYSEDYIFVVHIFGTHSGSDYFDGIVYVYDRNKEICCSQAYSFSFWFDHNPYKMIVGSKGVGLCPRSIEPHSHDHEEYERKLAEYKSKQTRGDNK